MRSSALSVADFMAGGAPDPDAAASSSAAYTRVATDRGQQRSKSVCGVWLEREQRLRPGFGFLTDVLKRPSVRSGRASATCERASDELGEHDVQPIDTVGDRIRAGSFDGRNSPGTRHQGFGCRWHARKLGVGRTRSTTA